MILWTTTKLKFREISITFAKEEQVNTGSSMNSKFSPNAENFREPERKLLTFSSLYFHFFFYRT